MRVNLSIKQKLIACLVVLGLGMAALSISGLVSNESAVARTSSLVEDRVKPLQQLKIISDLYAINVVDAAHKARGGSFSYEEALTALDQAEAGINENLAAYKSTAMTAEEEALVKEVDRRRPTPRSQPCERSSRPAMRQRWSPLLTTISILRLTP